MLRARSLIAHITGFYPQDVGLSYVINCIWGLTLILYVWRVQKVWSVVKVVGLRFQVLPIIQDGTSCGDVDCQRRIFYCQLNRLAKTLLRLIVVDLLRAKSMNLFNKLVCDFTVWSTTLQAFLGLFMAMYSQFLRLRQIWHSKWIRFSITCLFYQIC